MGNIIILAIVIVAGVVLLTKITEKTSHSTGKIATETHKKGQIQKTKAKKDIVIQNKKSNALTGEKTAKTAKTNKKSEPKKQKQGITNKKAVVNTDTGRVFESAREAARHYNCDSSSILKCCKGKQCRVKGYHWAYKKKSNKK